MMWRWVLPVAVVVAVLIGFLASRNGPTQHTQAHAPPTITTPPPATTAPTAAPTCGTKQPATGEGAARRLDLDGHPGVHARDRQAARGAVHEPARRGSAGSRRGTRRSPTRRSRTTSGVLAGDPHGLVHNSCGTACTTTAPSLLSQVPSWRAFIGGMPGAVPQARGGERRLLAALQPADVRDAARLSAVRPAAGDAEARAAAAGDRANALPAFTLIVPDGCHDTGFDKHCGGQAEAGGVPGPGRPVAASLDRRAHHLARRTSPARPSSS